MSKQYDRSQENMWSGREDRGGIDDGRKSEDGDILDGIVVTVMIGG